MKLKSQAGFLEWMTKQREEGSAISTFEDQISRLSTRVYKCAEPGCRPAGEIHKSNKYKPLCNYYVKIGKMDRNWVSRMPDGFLHVWIKGNPHTNAPPDLPSASASNQRQVCVGLLVTY